MAAALWLESEASLSEFSQDRAARVRHEALDFGSAPFNQKRSEASVGERVLRRRVARRESRAVAFRFGGADEDECLKMLSLTEQVLRLTVRCRAGPFASCEPPAASHYAHRSAGKCQESAHPQMVTPLMRGNGWFVSQFSKNVAKSRHSRCAFSQFAIGTGPVAV
jgi:hypothetical protein